MPTAQTSRHILCDSWGELVQILREHAKEHRRFLPSDDINSQRIGFECETCKVWWSAPSAYYGPREERSQEYRQIMGTASARRDFVIALAAIHDQVSALHNMLHMRYIPPEERIARPAKPEPLLKVKKVKTTVYDHLMDDD